MTMKLYDHPLSPNTRKIRALAIELGMELEIINVDLMKGEHKTPAYLAKNPNGKVPMFDEDGWILTESVAIMQYLADKKPEKGLYPTEARLRAKCNQWLVWDVTHLAGEGAFPLLQERWLRPMMKMDARAQVEEKALEQFNRFCAVLNGAVEGKQYLVGDRFTIADIAILGTFMLRDGGRYDLAQFPHLRAYLDRNEQRESWKKTAPAHMGA